MLFPAVRLMDSIWLPEAIESTNYESELRYYIPMRDGSGGINKYTSTREVTSILGCPSAIAPSNALIAGGAMEKGLKKKNKKIATALGHTTKLLQPCPPHCVSRLPALPVDCGHGS